LRRVANLLMLTDNLVIPQIYSLTPLKPALPVTYRQLPINNNLCYGSHYFCLGPKPGICRSYPFEN
jgi:hypothetical protein